MCTPWRTVGLAVRYNLMMKNSSLELKEQALKELQKRVEKLKAKPETKKKAGIGDESISIKVEKSQATFKRIKVPGERDIGHGEFFLLLNITALKEDIYIPLSIASGKKATGFMYHIEGTAEGNINTTNLSARGDGITKITLGTLLYAKIPALKTGEFRVLIEIRGGTSKEYKVVINRVNYKFDPSDARYQRLDVEINSKLLKFL